MSKRKTLEEFKKEVYGLVGNEYTILGNEYVNNHTKILMRHNKCGYEYLVTPNVFLSNNRCPKCNGGIKSNLNEFKNKVFKLVGNEYTVLGDYVNSKTKILIKHNKYGYEYYVCPSVFINNSRCPKCSKHIKNKTTEYFKEEVFDLVGDEYTILGDYVNSKDRILIQHNKCGYKYYVAPNNFLNMNNRCPKCSKRIKNKTTEYFKEEVYDLVGDEYSVLSDYKGTDTKILMKHNICGYKYYVTPSHFLDNRRCPKCRESKGEKAISRFLESINIEYNTQVSFPNCKYKLPLRFDFQIYIKGSSKIILLEYDGIQHSDKNQSFNRNEESFNEQQLRDNIKNEYCKNQGIHLYRISYKDFDNIEDILTDIIEKESRNIS